MQTFFIDEALNCEARWRASALLIENSCGRTKLNCACKQDRIFFAFMITENQIDNFNETTFTTSCLGDRTYPYSLPPG